MNGKRKFTQHIPPSSRHAHKTNDSEGSESLFCMDFEVCSGSTLRESSFKLQLGSTVPEPIDYEEFLSRNRVSISTDPHRELLLFPSEGMKLTRLPQMHRVKNAAVPPDALKPNAFLTNHLGRHTVEFFANSQWLHVSQPSAIFRGPYWKLPRKSSDDQLLGALSNYRFAIDQALTTTSQHGNTALNGASSTTTIGTGNLKSGVGNQSLPQLAGTRPWTAAVMSNRVRQTAGRGGGVDAGIPVNGESTSLHESDGSHSNRFNARLKSKTSKLFGHDELDGNGSVEPVSVAYSKTLPENPSYTEGSLAIGTREMYSKYLRIREGVLACGRRSEDAASDSRDGTLQSGMVLRSYCFRQLRTDELLTRPSTADRVTRRSFGSLSSAAAAANTKGVSDDQRLKPGLHIIAPLGWKASNVDLSCDREEVIFLDTISNVHQIGDNWLKLDRSLPTPLCSGGKLPSDRSLEVFIYFDDSGGPDQRQKWLRLIQSVIGPNRAQYRLGSQRSIDRTYTLNRDKMELNSGDHLSNFGSDTKSLSSQYSTETDVTRSALQRFIYNKAASINQSLDGADSRSGSRSLSNGIASLTRPLQSGETDARSTPPPFPDRSAQVCNRRFLATCLNLRSRVQALVENQEGNAIPQLDNPEPYFVTMFLVNTIDGSRVSEDFFWNPNSAVVDSMIPAELFHQLAWTTTPPPPPPSSVLPVGSSIEVKQVITSLPPTRTASITSLPPPSTPTSRHARGRAPPPPIATPSSPTVATPLGVSTTLTPKELAECRSALFSTPDDNAIVSNIYLVVRVDKVLNRIVATSATEKLTRAQQGGASLWKDDVSAVDTMPVENKAATALHKGMLPYCRHLGRYRMAFAWGARPLWYQTRTIPLFKMDTSKQSESSFIQLIQSFARLVESNSAPNMASGGGGDSFNSMTANEKKASAESGAPQFDRCEENTVEYFERNLKTQSVPVRLEMVVSELMDGDGDRQSLTVTNLVTADLVPLSATQPNEVRLALPSQHPKLRLREVIREVEHTFDISSAATTGTTTLTDVTFGDSVDGAVAGLRASQLGHPNSSSIPVISSGKSNRDSFVSLNSLTSSVSPSATSSTAETSRDTMNSVRSRTNSLDHPASRMPCDTTTGVLANSCNPDVVPFTAFHNDLYISPKSLNLAVKHNFSRARNLSCFMELRSTDDLQPSSSLRVFFARPSTRQPAFDTWYNTSVTHHEAAPVFNDTAKLNLPLHVTSEHHLLFRFYHVSVDTAGSMNIRDRPTNKKLLECTTGFAWMPLLGTDGNINTGLHQLPIAVDIQPGYLKLQSRQSRGYGSSITSSIVSDSMAGAWLEGGRPLFTVQLDCLSSIYTQDPLLSRFFRSCGSILGRVLSLPSPFGSVAAKPKNNRVTFHEDLVVPNAPSLSLPSSSDSSHRLTSRSRTTDGACVTHLCNAIKSLLLIDNVALVQFLPAILNQFMEILLIGATTGDKWAGMSHDAPYPLSPSGGGGDEDDSVAWMGPIKSPSLSSPNELLKTTLGTMTMLLSKLSTVAPPKRKTTTTTTQAGISDKMLASNGGVAGEKTRHHLLKAYVEYAFDATTLTCNCATVHAESTTSRDAKPNPAACAIKRNQLFSISLHHAIVRALILLLADANCANHIISHLLTNLWLPFELICKSMTQYLSAKQKIAPVHIGDSRFSASFFKDLSLLIKLLGTRLVHSYALAPSASANRTSVVSASDKRATRQSEHMEGVRLTSNRNSATSLPVTLKSHLITLVHSAASMDAEGAEGCLRKSDTQDAAMPVTTEHLLAQASRSHNHPTDVVDYLDAMAVSARFLGNLFNLIDRGFVMKRVRDLLVLLEVEPRMPPEKIDRLNELRFDLLSILSEHECFVQLNLPRLCVHQGTGHPIYDFRLTESFLQEHYLIGYLLCSLSCLLAGCINSGGWALGHNRSALHRRPLVLLRNLLAKHSLDTRYCTSKPYQARIGALYLPLVFLVLETPHCFGSPGGALQAAVVAAAARDEFTHPNRTDATAAAAALASGSLSASLRSRSNHNAGLTLRPAGGERPQSIVSDLSLETITSSSAGGSLYSGSHSKSSILSNGSSDDSIYPNGGSTRSFAAASNYLTEDNKVASHILEKIAGVPTRRAHWRKRDDAGSTQSSVEPVVTSALDVNNFNNHQVTSSLSSSTLTLTDLGELADAHTQVTSHNGASTPPFNHTRLHNRFNTDATPISANARRQDSGQDWSNQVLSLAGVLDVPPTTRPNASSLLRDNCTRSATSQSSRSMEPSQSHFHQHRLPAENMGMNIGPRRLTDKFQRELFVCVLHILSSVAEEHLIALYRSFTIQERMTYLNMLSYAIQHMRYCGKSCIKKYDHISRSVVGRVGLVPHNLSSGQNSLKRSGNRTTERGTVGLLTGDGDPTGRSMPEDTESRALLEANLATEAGLIVLDCLQTFNSVFEKELTTCSPNDPLFKGIFEVYIVILSNNPSDHLIRHTFAALRTLIGRHGKVLFPESSEVLSSLCLAGLRGANECALNEDPASESVAQIRLEACCFLYGLWKRSYEAYRLAGFHRVHLQTIISLSTLVGEIGPGFDSSLCLLQSLVDTDMCRNSATTGELKFWASESARNTFLAEVTDLIHRIRTVLAATAEIRQHTDDHERLVDLQYCLAKSYSSNPALRRSWLDELAKLHMESKNLAELAMTKLHTAALMAEYLKRRGEFPQGCDAFGSVSSNVAVEEGGLRMDSTQLEIPYTQDDLLTDVNEAAATMYAAGFFECVMPIYSLILPVYKARRNYTALSQIYFHISRAYEDIRRAECSGYRLFAAYFRVSFHGSLFESLAGKSFIYRTNACQKLTGMCTELMSLYRKQLGPNSVELVVDYSFEQGTLDPNKGYLQITYVEPYQAEATSNRLTTAYEKHHDVKQFMFETPFLMLPGMNPTESLLASGPKRSDDLSVQWKRRTRMTTEATFPHLRTRLEIVKVDETDLSPIDAAIDAISCKIQELWSHSGILPGANMISDSRNVGSATGDMPDYNPRVSVASIGIHSPILANAVLPAAARAGQAPRNAIPLLMDMQLQGALLTTVNAGPMAYAEAFLRLENQSNYPADKVARLRQLFFEFLTTCLVLLVRYSRLMSAVHVEKYQAMRQALDRYRVDLSNLIKEEIIIDEKRMVIEPKSASVD